MEKGRIHFYLEEIRAQKGIGLEEMESRLQIGRRKLQRFFAGTGKEASAARHARSGRFAEGGRDGSGCRDRILPLARK